MKLRVMKLRSLVLLHIFPAYLHQLKLTPSFITHHTVQCTASLKSVCSSRIGPRLPHFLLVASLSGNTACRTRHMCSLFPAANRNLLCHIKRALMFSSSCTSATA